MYFSERVMTLRRQTPPMLKILSPLKVSTDFSFISLLTRAFCRDYHSLRYSSIDVCCFCRSEITIRLDESDALSASSCHDGESERFVSTGSTGRRVSFNESALYEQEKTTQDKGRRYTATKLLSDTVLDQRSDRLISI